MKSISKLIKEKTTFNRKMIPLVKFTSNVNNTKENIFYNLADGYLDSLFNKLDSCEKVNFDNLEYSQGVLNFTILKNKHYVLNLQRPNKQIWLSSPISGPQRYEYDENTKEWINVRDKVTKISSLINDEINLIMQNNNILKEKINLL